MNNTPVYGRHRRNPSRAAFTLAELIVIIAVMAILAMLLLPAMVTAKEKSQRIQCAGNLKNIGMAVRMTSPDNSMSIPVAAGSATGESSKAVDVQKAMLLFRHFLILPNEMNRARALVCPSDQRTKAAGFGKSLPEARAWSLIMPASGPRNVSYFIGLNAEETMPRSLLSGDRNLMIFPGEGVIKPHTNITLSTLCQFGTNKATAGWSEKEMHKGQGNVVLGDGSVRQMNGSSIQAAINQPGESNVILLFPGDEEKP
jgi:prepilin-type processing-associated H-X9-DG protein